MSDFQPIIDALKSLTPILERVAENRQTYIDRMAEERARLRQDYPNLGVGLSASETFQIMHARLGNGEPEEIQKLAWDMSERILKHADNTHHPFYSLKDCIGEQINRDANYVEACLYFLCLLGDWRHDRGSIYEVLPETIECSNAF